MGIKNLKPEKLKEIFIKGIPLVDVRAPVEFQQGSLPGAVNLPILNDEERALIGTTYKNQGQEAAVKLGFELISGPVKEARLQAWKDFFAQHPDAVLYCFRGGQRSQITQRWLREAGVDRPLITGGYKAARTHLLKYIDDFAISREFLVVSGPTGSGKTHFLADVKDRYPAVDLEGLARHRGSAFGAWDVAQPTQINFENNLARSLIEIEAKWDLQTRPLLEDESRLIGHLYQPATFFLRLRSSQVIWLDEPMNQRVDNIFRDYITDSAVGRSLDGVPRCAEENDILRRQAVEVFDKYRRSLMAIQRKLGGLRTQEVLADLDKSQADYLNCNEVASNKVWIEKLLHYYYDPLYLDSLSRRQVQVCFKGPRHEAEQFVLHLGASLRE